MLGSCASWLPYVLAGLVGLGTAFWIWGGRKAAPLPEPRVVTIDDEPVVVKPEPAVAPVVAPLAAAAVATAAVAVKAKAKAPPKPKPAPVKKATVAAPTPKPATKAAAPKVKAAPVKKAAPVVKPVAAPKVKAAPVKKIEPVAAKPKPTAKPAAAKPKVAVKPAAKPTAKAAPKPAAKPLAKPAAKPKASAKPKVSIPDNLELLKGVGPKLNNLLKSLGVSSFEQVANWKASDIREIDAKLGNFAGRISRDNWVDQAKLLLKGDVKNFEKKYGPLGSEIKKG
jgi:predicted flap endonuclease-1-like 5' DNA nuclease